MTSSQGTGKKTGQKPNASQHGKWSLKTIHNVLSMMRAARSVTDPVRMFEELFEKNLDTFSSKNPVAEEILNIIVDMLDGDKKITVGNYILTYLPYDLVNNTLSYSEKKRVVINKNQSIILPLTEFFGAFKNCSLSLTEIKNNAAKSPKIKRRLLLGYFPPEFDEMDYHYYGSDGERKKRRKALVSIIESNVAQPDSWLKGAPKSPERAIAVALVIIERIKKSKKQPFSFNDATDAWKEDLVYLKYNYFDSVLHLNGLKWPVIGA